MGESVLANLRVLLGVSGGIAAYKAAELTRRLLHVPKFDLPNKRNRGSASITRTHQLLR